ncbi:MAG: Uma2 family endonuclease [Leptolyngbyaceae cyanobacterium RU_5_1]|nr:Uma2 family endonuclease [Leptolyngbyaceae cyanobacterium RU_5_1]
MVQAQTRFNSIEEYASLDTSDLPECRYELVDGVIVEMGAENDQNLEIAEYLASVLLQFVPYYLLRRGTEIQVKSALVTCREPDLTVLTQETRDAMRRDKRSLITLEMPNPILVVEIVSPGDETEPNYQRDYVQKPEEYAARGIPEFWRVDPTRGGVMVLWLEGTAYKVREFRGTDRVISPTFPQLQLTADQILLNAN